MNLFLPMQNPSTTHRKLINDTTTSSEENYIFLNAVRLIKVPLNVEGNTVVSWSSQTPALPPPTTTAPLSSITAV